jgi:hypothetical protein
MVGGEWLLRDKTWTTVDYPAAVAQMNKDYQRLNQNLQKQEEQE